MKGLTITVGPRVTARLERMAEHYGRSVEEIARVLLEAGLNGHDAGRHLSRHGPGADGNREAIGADVDAEPTLTIRGWRAVAPSHHVRLDADRPEEHLRVQAADSEEAARIAWTTTTPEPGTETELTVITLDTGTCESIRLRMGPVGPRPARKRP